MPNIIVKNYEHFNRALDTHVKNKDHYDRLMKQGGYVSYEEHKARVESRKQKEYKLSDKGHAIIQAAKNSKDSKGNVKLSDRTIDAMKEMGAIGKKIPSYMGVSKYKVRSGDFEK